MVNNILIEVLGTIAEQAAVDHPTETAGGDSGSEGTWKTLRTSYYYATG